MTSEEAQRALDELNEQFDTWRKNKKYNRERIPEALLEKAVELSKFIDDKKVRTRLGIPPKTFLQAAAGKPTNKTSDTQEEPIFTETRPPMSLQIEIQLPSGAKISVSNLNEAPLSVLQRLLSDALAC